MENCIWCEEELILDTNNLYLEDYHSYYYCQNCYDNKITHCAMPTQGYTFWLGKKEYNYCVDPHTMCIFFASKFELLDGRISFGNKAGVNVDISMIKDISYSKNELKKIINKHINLMCFI